MAYILGLKVGFHRLHSLCGGIFKQKNLPIADPYSILRCAKKNIHLDTPQFQLNYIDSYDGKCFQKPNSLQELYSLHKLNSFHILCQFQIKISPQTAETISRSCFVLVVEAQIVN